MSCPNGGAELSWRPGNDNGYRITNFFIQYNSSDNPTLWHTYEEPILPSWTNYYMNLRPWGTYSIRMLAENKLGLSKPSSPTKRTCSAPPSHPDRNPKEVWTRTDQTGKLIIQWTVSCFFLFYVECITVSKKIYKLFKVSMPLRGECKEVYTSV